MIVKELIEKLQALDQDAEVVIAAEFEGMFEVHPMDPHVFGKGTCPPDWEEGGDYTQFDEPRVQLSTARFGYECHGYKGKG